MTEPAKKPTLTLIPGDPSLDDLEALGPDVVEHALVHRLELLVLDHADVDGDRRPVRDDRIGFGPHEAALQSADGEGRVEHDLLAERSRKGRNDASPELLGGRALG